MAQKPLDKLSPSYRRRIERGLAKGKSRQSARGHKAKEHIIRKEREQKSGKLTTQQKTNIKNFAGKQSERIPGSTKTELYNQMLAWTERYGYDKFQAVKEYQKKQQEKYRKAGSPQYIKDKQGNHVPFDMSEEDFEDYIEYQFDLPAPPQTSWFWYK